MKEIFGLCSGAYYDWSCHGYYTTSEEAEKAAIQLSREKDEYGWSENYYVMPLGCLDGTSDIYKGKVIYRYFVSFSRYCSQRNKDYTENKPHIKVNTFADDDERIPKLFQEEGVFEDLQDDSRIKTNPKWSDYLICKWHSNRYLNEDQIKKIAYDMIAEWKAEKAGL